MFTALVRCLFALLVGVPLPGKRLLVSKATVARDHFWRHTGDGLDLAVAASGLTELLTARCAKPVEHETLSLINSSEDAQLKSMSTFETDEHLQELIQGSLPAHQSRPLSWLSN